MLSPTVPPSDLMVLPGPGYDGDGDDVVSKTLAAAHRMLEPIRLRKTSGAGAG
jgi:hypothetical protein